MLSIQQAANKLLMQHYADYQNNQAITVNGVTLAAGDGLGQSRQPTVEQLSAMGLALPNAASTGTYKSLTQANYVINISKSPSGCTAASAQCQVSGSVCLDKPVKDWSSAAGETDDVGIGAMLTALGGVGGVSVIGAPQTLIASNGAWELPNPYGSTPGIVCAMFGYGFAGDDYLRVADTRDPNLQGGLTLSGKIAGSNNTLKVNGDLQTAGLVLDKVVTLGTACTPEGAGAWSQSAGQWMFARCSNGVWKSVGGLVPGVVGAACSPNGAMGVDGSGVGLTCVDGKWQKTIDRIGQYVLVSSHIVVDGDVINKPTCNGVANAPNSRAQMVLGSDAQTKFQYVNRQLFDLGSAWRVSLQDETGSAILGNVVAQVYCYYP